METQVSHNDATNHLLKTAGFNIDDWPAFNACIEQASELFGRMLGKLLEGELSVELREVTCGPVGELIDVNQSHVTSVLRAENWDATLLAGTSRSSAFTIVELLFGGGGPVDAVVADRDCTNVELAAIELVFRHLGAVLQSSFLPIADPGVEPGICSNELMMDDLGGPSEPFVLVRLACQVGEQKFEVFAGFAQQTLSMVGDVLRSVPEDPADMIDPKWSEHFGRHTQRADVNLSAVMDGGNLTLDQVSRLQVGQVLELKSTSDSLIKVDCGGRSLLWCRLGQSDGSFVLRVEQFADAEQDLMDELLTATAAKR